MFHKHLTDTRRRKCTLVHYLLQTKSRNQCLAQILQIKTNRETEENI